MKSTALVTKYFPRSFSVYPTPGTADISSITPAHSLRARIGAIIDVRYFFLPQCVCYGKSIFGSDLLGTQPAQFTDSISYQALFYFLVIKPSITLSFGLLLIVLVPVSFVLVLPAPAMLRIVRRLGIWQANVAVEGLYLAVR